jgi:hypothetical protein
MNFAPGLSATKTGFDLIKSAHELLTKPDVNPAEVQARLLELQALMLEAQRALGEAEDENRHLQRQIDELRRTADFGKDFKFENGVYWYRDYPYCPNCWDVDRKPIRLTGPYGMTNSDWDCPIHKSKFYLKKYHEPYKV